jgi:hypothetical protein
MERCSEDGVLTQLPMTMEVKQMRIMQSCSVSERWVRNKPTFFCTVTESCSVFMYIICLQ